MIPRSKYLLREELLGESFEARLSRFALIVDNENSTWNFTERDANAMRTAEAYIRFLLDKVITLQREIEIKGG